MKLTKKTVKHEVETTETVCEVTKDEFEQLCAETASSVIVEFMGDEPDSEDFAMGVAFTHLFARFASRLGSKLFNDTHENPDKKEEK